MHEASKCHGMVPADFESGGKHAHARPLTEVWPTWVTWLEGALRANGKGTADSPLECVVTCWGGDGCESTWFHRVTEVQHPGVCKWPKGVRFFWDPCKSAKHYKTCKLNPASTNSADGAWDSAQRS